MVGNPEAIPVTQKTIQVRSPLGGNQLLLGTGLTPISSNPVLRRRDGSQQSPGQRRMVTALDLGCVMRAERAQAHVAWLRLTQPSPPCCLSATLQLFPLRSLCIDAVGGQATSLESQYLRPLPRSRVPDSLGTSCENQMPTRTARSVAFALRRSPGFLQDIESLCQAARSRWTQFFLRSEPPDHSGCRSCPGGHQASARWRQLQRYRACRQLRHPVFRGAWDTRRPSSERLSATHRSGRNNSGE